MNTRTHEERHAELTELVSQTLETYQVMQQAKDLAATYAAAATSIPGITGPIFKALCKSLYEAPGDHEDKLTAAAPLIDLLLTPSDSVESLELDLS